MIDGFFACLNTAVLGALFWYLYRRVIYGRLQHMQLLEHTTHLNSMKRQEALRKQEQGLVRAYYHQHYCYEELSKKIELWKRRLEEQEQAAGEEQEAQAEATYHRRALRDRYVTERTLCVAAMSTALLDVQRELAERFADKRQAEAYLCTILAAQSRHEEGHEER